MRIRILIYAILLITCDAIPAAYADSCRTDCDRQGSCVTHCDNWHHA